MKEAERKGANDLATAAVLAGWPTPNVPSGGQTFVEGYMTATGRDLRTGEKRSVHLQEAVQMLLSGWASPAARDYRGPNAKPYAERGGGTKGEQLPNQVAHFGPTPDSSTAETGRPAGYRLNPAFSLWLMGYRAAWLWCAPASKPNPRTRRKKTCGS